MQDTVGIRSRHMVANRIDGASGTLAESTPAVGMATGTLVERSIILLLLGVLLLGVALVV
jgi:hypothetical protein